MIAHRFIPMLALLVQGPVFAHDAAVPKTIEHHSVERLSQRIYAVYGPRGFPNKSAAGFMNNPAFIVGNTGVIVIDPGSSVQIGQELVKKIRKVTDKPVIAVFNTHVHGDHWLGNDGIRRAYPDATIYGHRKMIERIAAGEGEEYLRLFHSATDGATAGTAIVPPNVGLSGGESLEIDGIRLTIHHPGRAHTDTDLLIEVPQEQAVFLGDIVTEGQVPSSPRPQDAYFKGQLDALRWAADRPAKLFIPGHGRSGGRVIVLESLQFLDRLYGSVRKYFDQGLSDFDMKDRIIKELSQHKNWTNFSEMGRVIQQIYLEIEKESF